MCDGQIHVFQHVLCKLFPQNNQTQTAPTCWSCSFCACACREAPWACAAASHRPPESGFKESKGTQVNQVSWIYHQIVSPIWVGWCMSIPSLEKMVPFSTCIYLLALPSRTTILSTRLVACEALSAQRRVGLPSLVQLGFQVSGLSSAFTNPFFRQTLPTKLTFDRETGFPVCS